MRGERKEVEGRGGGLESLMLIRKDLVEEVILRLNYEEFGFYLEENE